MRRDTRGLLEDARDTAGYIAEVAAGATMEAFERDRRMRHLVERSFEIFGEAVNCLHRQDRILAERLSAYCRIVDLHYALIHEYDVIDHSMAWQTVWESLPVLRVKADLLRVAEDGRLEVVG